jgi:hypothetical protein
MGRGLRRWQAALFKVGSDNLKEVRPIRRTFPGVQRVHVSILPVCVSGLGLLPNTAAIRLGAISAQILVVDCK